MSARAVHRFNALPPRTGRHPHLRLSQRAWDIGHVSQAVAAGMIGLLVAGYASRLVSAPSLWFDEAMLLANIRAIGWADVLRPLPFYDQVAPAGYVALLKAIHATGGLDEALLRLPSLLALFVALGFVAALPKTSRPARIITAAVIAGSFVVARVVTDAKPYTFDIACAMALIVAFHPASRGLITHAACRFALLVIAIALATSFPMVAAATCGPALMLQMRADMGRGLPVRAWQVWRVAGPVAAAAVVYLVYYAAYIGPTLELVSANHVYLTRLGFAGEGQSYLGWFSGRVSTIVASHAGGASVAVMILAWIGVVSLAAERSAYALQIAMLAVAVIALNLAGRFPILEERFSIFVLPWLGIAAGHGVCRIRAALRDSRASSIVIVLAAVVALSPALGTIADPFHQDARRSLARLAADPATPVFGAQPILDAYGIGASAGADGCQLSGIGDSTYRCTAHRTEYDGAFAGRETKWYLINYAAAHFRGGETFGLGRDRTSRLAADYTAWVADGILRHRRAYYLAVQAERPFMDALAQRLAAHGTFRRVVDERPSSPTYAHGAAQLYLFEQRAP